VVRHPSGSIEVVAPYATANDAWPRASVARPIPREFGSGSTCYRRFRKWQQARVFELMHREMLR
jgi:transposase